MPCTVPQDNQEEKEVLAFYCKWLETKKDCNILPPVFQIAAIYNEQQAPLASLHLHANASNSFASGMYSSDRYSAKLSESCNLTNYQFKVYCC